ncbi:probable G-protein coupled receptor 139 [Mobula hypostoma]|uniref:probable G-protein coupled receptor 139 n=1 Tax=Mobula hypostoma TaxID=723540 RepID=UPI002FC32294
MSAGVYRIRDEYGTTYIDQVGRMVENCIKEHRRRIGLSYPEESAFRTSAVLSLTVIAMEVDDYRMEFSMKTYPFHPDETRKVPVENIPSTNLVAIVILSRGKCGLSKCVTRYLVGMAAADLLVVISDPLLRWTALIYFPQSFLFISPVCSLDGWLIFASTAASVWLTVAFTVDRFVAICCEKLKTKHCTERTAAVVIGTVSVLASFETLPRYFVYGPRKIIDGVPWYCVLSPSFTNSPSWAAFEMFHLILTPCVPFFLILLFNILTVRRILAASRARRGLRGQKSGENDKDREMENRRKSIVLLFSITGSFILLWGTTVVFSIYRRISMSFVFPFTDPRYITEVTSEMLQILSSCTNTCIYALTQSKFREELENAAKYPLNRILTLMKR